MALIITSEELKSQFYSFIKDKVAKSKNQPVLNIVQIGDDFASSKYINIKTKIATALGIKVNLFKYQDWERNQLEKIVSDTVLNKQGLIFQLPLPQELMDLVNNLDFQIDVDLLGNQAFNLWQANTYPPTIAAIDLVLKDILLEKNLPLQQKLDTSLDLSGKLVAVVGQGRLVGKPLLKYLSETGCSIVSINEFTKNPQQLTSQADILISAAGQTKLINQSYINPKTIIIDAATSEDNGVLTGDVDTSNLYDSNILVPSPGGIGKLTVLCLFYNLLKLENIRKN